MSYGTSYRNYYNTRTNFANPDMPSFKTLADIEKVLDELKKNKDEKGHATQADFYKLTNGDVFEEDFKYGWTELVGVNVRRTRYGYVLQMPVCGSLFVDPNMSLKTAIDILDNADEDSLEDAANDVRNILNEMIG